MAVSLTVVSFIIVGLMLLLLFIVVGTILSYVDVVNKFMETRREEIYPSKPTLVITNISIVNDTCFTFRLNNTGSMSTLLDSSMTVIVDYYENATLEHHVESLEFNVSWYVVNVTVGSRTYTIPRGYVVELKPGQSANILACVSYPISTSKSVVVVVSDSKGVKAEYVFTYG